MTLRHKGADAVIPETLETGLQLAGATLGRLGIDEDQVRQSLEHERTQRIEHVAEPGSNRSKPPAGDPREARPT